MTATPAAPPAAEPRFRRVLVANRGAVAMRVIRALRSLGIGAVAVHSDADAGAPWAEAADAARRIGPAPARESYLDQDGLIAAAIAEGCDAVHPGYGFLSENAGFARRVRAAGLAFIGPDPRWIEAMGEKTQARALMAAHGMPVAPGSPPLGPDPDEAAAAAAAIGYPVLVKPASGGGGIGMVAAKDRAALLQAVERARSAAARSFGEATIYLEKLLERPRHVEIQLLGDRHGAVRHLFERDCSLQRRHQKVIEEAPAPGLRREVIDGLAGRTAAMLAALGYDNIGTVEMLMGADGGFAFLEMNTRLQVEHAVTEMVLGLDLVAAQIRAAAGVPLSAILPDGLAPRGHAMEARIYAEDPRTFFPSPGTLARFRLPAGTPALRIETGYREGMTVTPHYDPLLAKVIAHGGDRAAAIALLADALSACEVEGLKTNIPFLLRALVDPRFAAGEVHTGLAAELQG
ncbi:acetyl-CoA carboxylase biotin carboxylase subunit [Falsiroseomonas sp. CW058]|uniref:acetyl-CoA carboxylase biotin carboxylase subunit n=1 Tax=Falsiroseomonas sp. CW058 TaxID=3388664 RepID=UPI003D3188F6